MTTGNISATSLTLSGGFTGAKSTVASATTPDIWTGTGNLIDYTGTVTATGFGNAPQAGASRTLICSGAAVFTAGANLLIQGVPSGSNFTAVAGNAIDVFAVTTTQFRMRALGTMATQKANAVAITGGAAALDIGGLIVGTDQVVVTGNGVVILGATAIPDGSTDAWAFDRTAGYTKLSRSTTGGATQEAFYNPNGIVGSISTNGSATAFNTSSDYRLKTNIQPLQNALNTVAKINPVTFTWKVDGTPGQGFIAHELQAVIPDCVTGEKDAVDADGKPVYQGVDASFLIATLVAAIQELTARLNKAGL